MIDGKRLRTRRIQRGLSQRALAVLAQTDQKAISSYETGTRSPHPRTLMRLAQALGCTPSTIMKRE